MEKEPTIMQTKIFIQDGGHLEKNMDKALIYLLKLDKEYVNIKYKARRRMERGLVSIWKMGFTKWKIL